LSLVKCALSLGDQSWSNRPNSRLQAAVRSAGGAMPIVVPLPNRQFPKFWGHERTVRCHQVFNRA
jgi:hypothetical protein